MGDFNNLKNIAKQKGNEVIDEAKDKSSSIYEKVKNSAEYIADQAQDTAAEYYSEGKRKVEQAYDATIEHKEALIETIKEKPLASILIAAGIGYLISKLRSK